jgi:hypothetical protein
MPSLSLYRRLSALSRPRTYVGKMLFVAFVGTHVPLIGLILYFVFSTTSLAASWPLLVATLVATLVGTTLTMLPQRRLLAPVLRTSDALIGYVEGRRLPALPAGHADGPGLPENEQDRIFEPFQTLDEHTAGDEQGSGLGLWISRALTEAMGGRLTVESAPGEGATFRMRLPWTAPHDEEAPVPAFPAASSPPVDGRASSQRADTVPSPSSRAHR